MYGDGQLYLHVVEKSSLGFVFRLGWSYQGQRNNGIGEKSSRRCWHAGSGACVAWER